MTDHSSGHKLQLFPVAIGEYAHHDWLDVDPEVTCVAELFEEFGGQHVPWDVPMTDRDGEAVADRLHRWSGTPTGCSVLYWVGHGWSNGSDASLAHATSPKAVLSFGVVPKNLADHIAIREGSPITIREGSGSDAAWAIVIIDACRSARFVELLNAEVDNKRGQRRLLLVGVSGGGSTNLGHFSAALRTIFGDTFRADPEIKLWSLSEELGRNLPGSQIIPKNIHKAVLRRTVTPVAAVSPLDVRAEIEAVLSELPEDERRHFIPKAQGSELGEVSWYFQGRLAETRRIVGWLRSARRGLLVVTGRPGSGKSALLGHLVVQSRPLVRAVLARHELTGELPPEDRPPDDVFDAILHLTGLIPLEVIRRLAADLGLPKPEPGMGLPRQVRALCSGISGGTRTRTILVDALDEAVTPVTVARAVLRPLAALRNLRVVVGTRGSTREDPDQREPADRELLDALGAAVDETVEVDSDASAITSYVHQRLTTALSRGTPAASEEAVQNAAAGIGNSGREFLFARLAVHEILAQPALLTGPGLDELVSSDHKGLFTRAVSRLEAKQAVNAALLAALAFAHGRGAPIRDGVWAAVASALSGGREISDPEISKLLKAAAPYIVLDREHGQSVHRLAHRTFAQHFTHEPDGADDARAEDRRRHQDILHRLVAEAARRPEGELNPYLRGHLSAHAGAVGAVGWQYLADHPEVLHRLDPEAVGADVMRTVFGRIEPPPEITGLVGARHLLKSGEVSDRPGLRQLAIARYAGVRQATDPCLQDGAEWAVRWAGIVQQPLHVTLPGHPGGVWALAAVPGPGGATLLASGSGDGVVRLWDLATCTEVGRSMSGHRGGVTALATVAGAGGHTLLASGSGDGVVRRWDPVTGTELGQPMAGHTSRVTALVEVPGSADRTLLASASWDGTVRRWDPATGAPVGEPLKAHLSKTHVTGTTGVTAVAALVGSDGRTLLVSGGGDGVVRRWDPATGTAVGQPLTGHNGGATAVAALPGLGGSTLLASGSGDGVLRWWGPATGTAVGQPVVGHTSWVTALAEVSGPDGRALLASASADGTVQLWDPATGTGVGQPLTGHTSGVTAVAALLGPGGQTLLASGSRDGTVRLWAPATGSAMGQRLSGHTRDADAEATLPGPGRRTRFAIGGNVATVRSWFRRDTRSGRLLASHTGQIYALAELPGPDGRALLASGSDDGLVRLWDATSGDLIGRPLTGHTDRVNAVAAVPGPDGRTLLASGSDDGTVRFWDPATGRCIRRRLTSGDAGSVNAVAAVSGPGGIDLSAAGCGDGTVRLWAGRRWRSRRLLARHVGQVYAVTALPGPSGRILLASGDQTGTVRLWDATAGDLVGQPLTGHTNRVNGVTALPGPGGRMLLASGSADRTVRLWEATGTELGQPLTGHTGAVNAIAALPGPAGRTLLASGDSDGTVWLWDPVAVTPVTELNVGMPVLAISPVPGGQLAIGTPEGIAVLRVRAAAVEGGRVCGV